MADDCICCVLCGAMLLQPWDASMAACEWMSVFRAGESRSPAAIQFCSNRAYTRRCAPPVYTDLNGKKQQARLSGLGIYTGRADIEVDEAAPTDEEPHPRMVRIQLLSGHPRYKPKDAAQKPSIAFPCGFPFHEACWAILAECCPKKDVDIQALSAC
jgi:hypothetical protein